jgi:hypothetical protein
MLPVLVSILKPQIVRASPGRFHTVNSGTDEPYPGFILCPVVIFLVLFAEGAHVHEEDHGFEIGIMLLCGKSFLDGIHAAHTGTVPVSPLMQITRPHALQPGDSFGRLLVGRPQRAPMIGPVRIENRFKLKAGDDVWIFAVPECIEHTGIEDLEARSDYDGPDPQGDDFVRPIGSRGWCGIPVQSAGFSTDLDLKIPRFPFHRFQFRHGQYVNIEVTTTLHEFVRNDAS